MIARLWLPLSALLLTGAGPSRVTAPAKVDAGLPSKDTLAVPAEAPPRPDAPTAAELEAEARERAAALAREGYDGPKAMIDLVEAVFGEQPDGKSARRHAARLVSEALDAQRTAEQTWPALTDCDRLDRAFAALERRRILARQDYSDCQTCGHAELADLMEKERDARGYTFFHDQDTEGAAQDGLLYLAYGARKDTDAALVAIGKEIVAALKEQELKVHWNGKADQRIGVKLDWKKRRFTRPADAATRQ